MVGPGVKLTSQDDVVIKNSFTTTTDAGATRNFGSQKSSNIVRKSIDNTFSGKITFNNDEAGEDDLVVKTNIVADNIVSDSADTVLLNGDNILDFDGSIVRRGADVVATIKTPVTIGIDLPPERSAKLTDATATVDGRNVVDYLDARVLLDEDHEVTVPLTSPKFTFVKGLEITPTSNTYFGGKSLVNYENDLFKFSDTSVSGVKTLTGSLTAGTMTFADNVHPFGVDLPSLYNTGLVKSRDQVISVPYTINNINSVKKIVVDKVDGVMLEDVCLIDEECVITCSGDVPECVHFNVDVVASGGITFDKLEGVDMSTVLTSLNGNDNNYKLSSLKIPSGGLDWVNDVAGTKEKPSVSGLLSNLVTKSGSSWSSRGSSDPVSQQISGTVSLAGTIFFNDITVDSGKINEGAHDEFDVAKVDADGAKLNENNVFTSHKVFSGIKAAIVEVGRLEGVVNINDVNLADYRTNALVTDDEAAPGNQDFEQVISGSMTFTRGIDVQGQLTVLDTIAGCVKVEDIVQENVIHNTKTIPKITFNEVVLIDGDVVATGTGFQTKIDDFMTNRVKLSSDQAITQNLHFTGSVGIGGVGSSVDTTVETLNNIPASTWVKTGVDTDKLQTISSKKTYSQDTLVINGNLLSDDIDGTDLSANYGDALKLAEDATIAGPDLVFEDVVVVEKEKIRGNLPKRFHNYLMDFIADISTFVNNLYKFYVDNIVSLIPSLDQEIKVAQNLNLGTLAYIEEVKVPDYLKLDNVDADKVTPLLLDDNLYSMNYLKTTECDFKKSCVCEETYISSQFDNIVSSNRLSNYNRIFSFSLPSGTYTFTSAVDSTSDTCNRANDTSTGGLVASVMLHNPDSVSQKIRFLSPNVVGTALKPQVPCVIIHRVLISSISESSLYRTSWLCQGHGDVGAGRKCLCCSGLHLSPEEASYLQAGPGHHVLESLEEPG